MRNIVVVGGSSGLGFECARRMVGPENQVLCWSRRLGAPDGASKGILDLALYDGAEVCDELAAADLLLVSGGMGAFYGPHQLDSATVDRMFATNTRGPILLANRYLLEHRHAKRSGRVVIVTSTAAQHAGHGLGLYGASKAAVETWVRAEGPHQRRYGVDIVAASLGWFDSPMTDALKPEVKARAQARCPHGRFATLGEAADFTLMLCQGERDGGAVYRFWEPVK